MTRSPAINSTMYVHLCASASLLLAACLAILATLASCAAAQPSTTPTTIRLRLSVVPPHTDAASSTATATADTSNHDSSSLAVVTGGMLLVNMTAYSPITKHGIIDLPLAVHPSFPTRHRLSLNHPAYVYPDLLVSIPAAPSASASSSTPPVSIAWSPLDRSNKYKGKPVDTAIVAHQQAPGTYVARATWVALAPRRYFEERPGFNPLSMLKSPMMFMPVLSLGLLFVLPKLSAMLDEAKAEATGGEKKDEQSALARHFKSL